MATSSNEYRPDYAVPFGWILKERLESEGLTQAAFARLCDRSAKLISEIITGKAPIEPRTAIQFERVLNVDSSIWLGLESAYQLHRAREVEAEEAIASVQWSKGFPIRELRRRGLLPQHVSDAETVSALLAFFRVASVEAWKTQFQGLNVAYRHSRSFRSDDASLATWLWLGEIEAGARDCETYSKAKFRQALYGIRNLTREPIEAALPRADRLCADAGVALVLVPPLPKTALSGAARWLSPRKALIQLSARYKTDDHLWCSFFHEAAHILLHSKKRVFVEEDNGVEDGLEEEANIWASDFLVARVAWDGFVSAAPRSKRAVQHFAAEQGIAPGIIVGRLQREGHVPWSHLNGLKTRLEWKSQQ